VNASVRSSGSDEADFAGQHGGLDTVAELQLFEAALSSRVIATVLPCVETPGDPGVVEFAFATMKRERDRIDAEIAHLTETRDALDLLLSALCGPVVIRR
jgi:hypothetical protein